MHFQPASKPFRERIKDTPSLKDFARDEPDNSADNCAENGPNDFPGHLGHEKLSIAILAVMSSNRISMDRGNWPCR
jgi:hypothetical protein